MRVISVSELRRDLGLFIDTLDDAGSIQIVRHGETVAHLLSPKQYEQLMGAFTLQEIRNGNVTGGAVKP